MTVRTAAVLKSQFEGRDPKDHNTDLVDTIGDPAILPAATTTAAGKVELATNAEAIAGTDATRAVTPANLAAMTAVATAASSTAAGVIELATDAEAQAGTMTDRAITPANLAAVTGTTARAGVLELATDAEAQTGSDTARAITPANLQAVTGTATRAGVLELATDAEAKTGTDTARAVTAANVRAVLTGLKFISLDGRNGAGACTATGAVAGDKVLYVAGLTGAALGNASASFEATVTVNDQVQQSLAGDLSLNDYLAVLLAVA